MGSLISSLVSSGFASGLSSSQFGPWRPPQWSKPAMVSITVPATTQTTHSTATPITSGALFQGQSTSTAPVSAPTTYVFDAVLRLNHSQRLTKTHHPVQNGADLSSHAYLEPAHLVMYVGMSDAMAAYASGLDSTQPPYVAAFTGNPSKSVSAYQQMLTLQAARQPLTVTTRLRTYNNMLITSIEPEEDSRTITGLRMRVEFEQIYTAVIVDTPASARSQDTNSTGLGVVNAQTPDATTTSQFGIASTPTNAGMNAGVLGGQTLLSYVSSGNAVDVPGAGTYSSVNTNNLSQLPSP